MGSVLHNRALLACLVAWFTAQIAKYLIDGIRKEGWSARRLFLGSGGMPSSHTAFVSCLATMAGMTEGFDSLAFAMCFVLAFIVMTDAAGVRRSAGKQAELLNKLVQDLVASGEWPNTEKLKEMLGHTPFQVIIGGLLGILVALLFM